MLEHSIQALLERSIQALLERSIQALLEHGIKALGGRLLDQAVYVILTTLIYNKHIVF